MPKEITPSSGNSSETGFNRKRKASQSKKPSKQSKKSEDSIPIEEKILNYNIDPYDFNDANEVTLINYAVAMFRHFDLLEEFNIKEEDLKAFFQEVRKRYNPENSFHNFKHVWCVMHMSFQILVLGGSKYLESRDILAVLIAAICHDISHPGNSNAFEMATKSAISQLYCKESYPPVVAVLEQHHASLTEGLLKGPYGKALTNKMTAEEKKGFLLHVNQIIMATDMAKHHELVLQAAAFLQPPVAAADASAHSNGSSSSSSGGGNGKKSASHPIIAPVVTPRARYSSRLAGIHINRADPEVRVRFTRVLVHSADIGAQTQCLQFAYRWVDRMYAEFRNQAVKEKHLGIITSPFLHDISLESKKFADQCNFINNIVEPMWKALSDLLPELKFAYSQLLTNKAEYRDRVGRENELELRQQLNLVTSASNCAVVESGSSSGSNSHDEQEE